MTDTEHSDDREKALQLMADYLKGKLADQLATTRDADSKVNLRLTICAAVVGLLAYVLPPVGRSQPAKVLVYLSVGAFGFCLLKVLASALAVLKARLNLPGVKGEHFRSFARDEGLTPVKVLVELVQNYTSAAEDNEARSKERKPHVDALRDWSERAVWTGFLAIALSGIVYVIADFNMELATENECMSDEVQQEQNSPAATPVQAAPAEAAPPGSTPPAASPSSTPTATPAADEKPSLIAAPEVVDLTQKPTPEPMRGDRIITKQEPEKKQE